jgi:hypothetical protein
MRSSGSSQLSELVVEWSIPFSASAMAGGLEYLPAPTERASSSTATWLVEEGPPRRPAGGDAFDAFYGDTRVRFAASSARVWSPVAAFDVTPHAVSGQASGNDPLAAAIALHSLAAWHGVLAIHAAAFTIDGSTYLLPGPSGAGKTTTSLAVASSGGQLLADDIVYVDAACAAWGIRRPPHATSVTRRAFSSFEDIGPVMDGRLQKRRLKLPYLRVAPTTIDVVLIPELDRTTRTHVEHIDSANVFAALLASSLVTLVNASPRRDALLDRLVQLAELPAARLVSGPDMMHSPRTVTDAIRTAHLK